MADERLELNYVLLIYYCTFYPGLLVSWKFTALAFGIVASHQYHSHHPQNTANHPHWRPEDSVGRTLIFIYFYVPDLSASQACQQKWICEILVIAFRNDFLVTIGQIIANYQWYTARPEMRPPSPRWRPDDPVRHISGPSIVGEQYRNLLEFENTFCQGLKLIWKPMES